MTDPIRETLMVAGVATMASSRSDWADRGQAQQRFQRVIAMSPPQQDIETFDPILASALVWQQASVAANDTSLSYRLQTGSLIDEDEPARPDPAGFFWAEGRPAGLNCAVRWTSQPEPRFPAEAQNREDPGAVLAGFHFNSAGEPIDVRVLAEVPTRAGYGDNVVRAIKKWRAEPLPEGCRRNHVITYRFYFT